ncbi:hypothetical protein C7413_10136 [Paraburkholderia silvatlantica]|nr:hypothetical protein C7411_10136 [Paraburkholderia silvatlantica]PXW42383.1 hypothetical protein C7413_10136 [Paraburkholderia silvatlantica]
MRRYPCKLCAMSGQDLQGIALDELFRFAN